MIGVASFVGWAKTKQRHKYWFKAIGNPQANKLNTLHPIWRSDYRWWLIAAASFFVWWFAAYFVVSFVLLGEYNVTAANAASHGGITFVWDPSKRLTNGDFGGFNAYYVDDSSKNGTSLMPYVMRQTNVTYYLFELVNKTLSGRNLFNQNTPVFVWPDGTTINETAGANLRINPNQPPTNNAGSTSNSYYINDVLTKLGTAGTGKRGFIDGIMNEWLHSYVYSNVLVTPLCQMMGLVFPTTIMLSYKRDFASFVAPWAMLGGAVTVYGGIVADPAIHVTVPFIFYDQGWFFGYHFFIMTTGLAWFVYCNRFNLVRFGYTYLFIILYVIYINIVAPSFNIQYFTTGLTAHDLAVGGSYAIVSEMLIDTSLTFPGNAALMIWVFATLVIIFIAIKNLVHGRWWKKQQQPNENFVGDVKQLVNQIKGQIHKAQMHFGKSRKVNG